MPFRLSTATLPVVDPHVRLDESRRSRGPAADPLAPLNALYDGQGGCHLLRAVHVQADLAPADALADVERVQAMAHTRGSGGLPNGIVACCDLATADAPARLDALARHPNLRGVRPPAHAPLPADLAPLERFDLLLELPADAFPSEDIARLAKGRPGCRLVLHDAGAASTGIDASARRRPLDLHPLRRLDNVLLKLGYREAGDPADTPVHLRALVEHALEALGPERVMLASGFPDADRGRPWSDAWRAFAAATKGIAPRRRDGLFRTNAVRAYRL